MKKFTNLDEFSEWFSQHYGTAMEIWMPMDRIGDLYNMYETDIYKFIAVPKVEIKERFESKGWHLFEEEFNFDNYDAILYKLK